MMQMSTVTTHILKTTQVGPYSIALIAVTDMQLCDHNTEVWLWREGSPTKASSWFSSQSGLQPSPVDMAFG